MSKKNNKSDKPNTCYMVEVKDIPVHIYDHNVVVPTLESAKKYIVQDLIDDGVEGVTNTDLTLRKTKRGFNVRHPWGGMKYKIVECIRNI